MTDEKERGSRAGPASRSQPDGQLSRHSRQPVSLVEVTEDGRIFVFVVGPGLLVGQEGSPAWKSLSNDFGDRILLHLAADPSNADRLYAVTQKSEVLASQDGGKTWQRFGSGNPLEEG
jgi:photosystem II stability/assembly factor-like uncharacterized protein